MTKTKKTPKKVWFDCFFVNGSEEKRLDAKCIDLDDIPELSMDAILDYVIKNKALFFSNDACKYCKIEKADVTRSCGWFKMQCISIENSKFEKYFIVNNIHVI